MVWILLSIVPLLFGLMIATRCRPQNRGKKKAQRAFTIGYPSAIVNCMSFTAIAMMAVLAATAYFDFAALNSWSVYYMVYVICIGFVVAIAMHLNRRSVSFSGEKIVVTKSLFGKGEEYPASRIAQLDVRKTEVRVLDAEGVLIFSAGMMMENLDLFFAWTHERPGIKVTLNGKELPQKGNPTGGKPN